MKVKPSASNSPEWIFRYENLEEQRPERSFSNNKRERESAGSWCRAVMSTGSISDPEDEVCAAHVESSGPRPHLHTPAQCHSVENSEDEDVGGGVCERGRGQSSRRVQRSAANARERARMRVLGRAFTRLRTTLPWVPPDTKLSKLDTLRLAASYITHLRQLLQEDTHSNTLHPAALSWPFMVSGRPDEAKEISSALRLCGATA